MSKPVLVTTGEHGEFTRLVLEISPGATWGGLVEDERFIVTLPDHRDGFDTTRAYDRITRSRISGLEASRSSLDLILNCACEVDASRMGPNLLVLDVREVSPVDVEIETQKPTTTPQDVFSFPDNLPHSQQTLSFGILSESTEGKIPDLDVAKSDAPESDAVRIPARRVEQNLASPSYIGPIWLETNETVETDAETEALENARDRLAEEFGVAATRGILRAGPPSVTLPSDIVQPQIDTRIFNSSEVLLDDQVHAHPIGNMQITTSSDADFREVLGENVTDDGVMCISPTRVALGDWVDGETLQHSVGMIRKDLFGEFDTPNPGAILKLARTYLHFGFGAEAMVTLQLDPRVESENRELSEIAEILEFGYVQGGGELAGQLECDSAAALWGILALKKIPKQSLVNANAALLALNSLPLHLRRVFAPDVSDRLLEYGDKESAKIAMRALERLPEKLDMKAVLAKAEIDIADGKNQEAEDKLAEVIESNSIQSALALIKLVDAEMANSQDVSAETAGLAEAYAMELRDHELGPDLKRVHVLALAKSNQFDAAFEALGDLQPEDQGLKLRQLFSNVMELLSANAADTVFLRRTFASENLNIAHVSTSTLLKISQRLLDLGFAEKASILFADNDVLLDSVAGKMLRARIALEMRQPALAESVLFEIQGRDAEVLRARAKLMSGQDSEAHAIFASVDDVEGVEMTAWLSDDWENLTSPENPTFGPLVVTAQTELPPENSLDGLLGRTESALTESARARSAIQETLDLLRQP